MATKKATGKRAASKGSPAKKNTKSKTKPKQEKKDGMNPQTKAILLLLCAVILLALAIFPGAVFWETIRGFFYGVFGVGFILIPFLLGYLAIMTAKEKIIAFGNLGYSAFFSSVLYL